MNIYDLLNIGNLDREEVIKDTIEEVKNELKGLTEVQTCKIYSDYVGRKLRDKHVVNKVINTSDLDCSYEHQFILVPIEKEKYYLIDLTYSQFQSNELEELKDNGYLIVGNDMFSKYIKIVSMDDKDILIDDAYFGNMRKIK